MKHKAQEMFEELGYIYNTNENIIIYENYGNIVTFDLNNKRYCAHDEMTISHKKSIYVELHKAIHQQMKELGWLDE